MKKNFDKPEAKQGSARLGVRRDSMGSQNEIQVFKDTKKLGGGAKLTEAES